MNYKNRNMKITFNQMRVGTSQLLFWLFLTQCVSASMLNLRGLKNLNEIQLHEAIPCNPGTNGTSCVCPAKCLMYSGETGGCHPMDCWSYSDIKDECNEAGKEFLPALLLQIFLGAFGSGFGNIGRWDIFGIFMSVLFGGCLFVCCCGMCCHCINKKEEQQGATALGTKCGGCLWSLAISVIWIWGIVVIANKEVKGEWTNYKGDPILCPMIG